MRVEQRIGRIDRIGQTYDKVWIFNYFYEDTIEDKIYRALEDRINWFESVVGSLQPILAEVSEMTKRLAMLPAAQQAVALDREIRELRAKIDEAKLNTLTLDEYTDLEDPGGTLVSPVTLTDLQDTLTTSSATSSWFEPHPEIHGAYSLSWDNQKTAVTFQADLFDQHPNTLAFLSYGSHLLDRMLAAIGEPEALPPTIIRYTIEGTPPVRAWYDLRAETPQLVTDLRHLVRLAESDSTGVTSEALSEAQHHFEDKAIGIQQAYQAKLGLLGKEKLTVLAAQAKELLHQAALVEIALGQRPSLFSEESYPVSFNEAAVVGLKRHNTPWTWMLVYAGNPLPSPRESDPFYNQIRSESAEKLKALFKSLTDQANAVRQDRKATEN